jgi:hypothetical protein
MALLEAAGVNGTRNTASGPGVDPVLDLFVGSVKAGPVA